MKFIQFTLITVTALCSLAFSADVELSNVKILGITYFTGDPDGLAGHKAGQLQIQIEPKTVSPCNCNTTYFTNIDTDNRNYEALSAILLRAYMERKYVHMRVSDQKTTFPGRCTIVAITPTSVSW